MEAPFAVNLLGPVEIRCHGIPIHSLRSRHARWLLALLVLREGKEVNRRWLAAMLWPDADVDTLACLRPNLTDVRQALGDQAFRLVSPNRQSLKLNLDGAEVDVFSFDRAIAIGDADSLKRAVELYRGPLVEDCSDSWILAERQQREQQFLNALSQLAERAVEESADEEAILYLKKATVFDPTGQDAYRSLMHCYERAGAYQAALDTYYDLSQYLRKHGGEIDPATMALVQQIRTRQKDRQSSVKARHTEAPRRKQPLHLAPQYLTELIGREEEAARLEAHIGITQLLTLTGPGGVGKTRLAVHAAERAVDYFPDEAWFVDFGVLSNPDYIPQVVGRSLGVEEPQQGSWTEAVLRFLRSRKSLLVLDNCEHLTDACARFVKTLLGGCRDLCILAASRCRLGIAGEVVWRVPPLGVPAPDIPVPLEALQSYSAISLFVKRASDVRPGFCLTRHNAPAVVSLCRQLDGLPLALELAAGLMEVLSEADIVARLNDRFSLLVGMDQTTTERHQSLLAVMDLSYSLLSKQECTQLQRLCVFMGGWELDAAAAVCQGEELTEKNVVLLMARLCAKSLVEVQEWDSRRRYHLLEMVRQYGLVKWQEADDRHKIARQHALFYLHFAEDAEPHLMRGEQAAWLDRLEREHENLKAALYWCCAVEGEAETALRLAGVLWRFWYARHANAETQDLLQRVLEVSHDTKSAFRQKVLRAAGNIAYVRGQMQIARAHFEESRELARALGNELGLAAALGSLANVANSEHDYLLAWQMFTECLAHFQAVPDRDGEAVTLANLAIVACNLEEHEKACSLHQQSLTLFKELKDLQNSALACNNMAATVLRNKGHRDICRFLQEGSARSLAIENWRYVLHSLTNYLAFALSHPAMPFAAMLLGAIDAMCERFNISVPDKALGEHERMRADIKERLEPAEFLEAYQRGSAKSVQEIIHYAQAEARLMTGEITC